MKQILVGLLFMLSACGDETRFSPGGVPTAPLDYVLRARAEFSLSNRLDGRAANPTSVPVSYVSVPSATMTVSTAALSYSLTDDTLDLGAVSITNLRDNGLKVCGVSSNQHCNQALILVYTTGMPGAGMWNTADSYGAPLFAGLSSLSTVGLNQANAAVVQTKAIPSNQNVFRLSDFAANPTYQIESDFSNAGAGSYSTTLVIEYGLSL